MINRKNSIKLNDVTTNAKIAIDKKSKSTNVNSIRASVDPFNMCSLDKVFHGHENGVKVRAASLFMNRRIFQNGPIKSSVNK